MIEKDLKISKTIDFVKKTLEGAEAGHDWYHTERVWKIAKMIAETEECDRYVVELSALLHDIADPKFHNGDENLAISISSKFLREINVEQNIINDILFIIKNISFKNKDENRLIKKSKEFEIVQDADRLDAIGAIGIARTFHFGGFRNNLIHDPNISYNKEFNKEEYKKYKGTTINHFYEKLLLLKDYMNTEKGRELANKKHDFMLLFLERFYDEWDLKD